MDKSLLNRATNTDDAPTPGYLYGEIARMTLQSYETCEKVMEFLVARVKKKNHNTKYKSLQVIKHVCREGRADFRKEMQKHTSTIKECLQFRGPPDPLKGDEYFKRVREAAKDCLDAIFDTNSLSSGPAIRGRISGIGSAIDEQSGGGWGGKFGWGGSGNTSSSGAPLPNTTHPGFHDSQQRYNAPGGGEEPPYGEKRNSYGHPEPNYGAPSYNDGQNRYGSGGPSGGGGGAGAGSSGGPSGYPNEYGGNLAPPYGSGQSRFAGISNPAFADARDDKSFLQGLKEKAASKFNRTEQRHPSSGAPPGSHNPPNGWSYATNRGPTSGSYGGSGGSYNPEESYDNRHVGFGEPADRYSQQQHDTLRERAYTGPRKKGGVGGAWGAAPTRRVSKSSEDRETSRRNSVPTKEREMECTRSDSEESLSDDGGSHKLSTGGNTSGATSDGHYERGLVSALCAPGGMRAVPPKDKIDLFVKSAVTLDADIVGPMLEERLFDSTWQVNSKALCVIEALLEAPGCDHFVDFFTEKIPSIERCESSDKAAVRDKAVRVLRMLGGKEATPSPIVNERRSSERSRGSGVTRQHQHHHQHHHHQQQLDLLGDFANVPTKPEVNIFQGLQQSQHRVEPPQETSHTPVAAPVAASAAPEVMEMFGGLKISGETTTTTAAPAQATPPPAPVQHVNQQPEKRAVNFDPLLEPVSTTQQQQQQLMMNRVPMNPQLMGMGMPTMGGVMNPQQMMALQMQMQQLQMMAQMGMSQPTNLRPNVSPVIGSVMTPSGIAKTIQEPTTNNGFGFMKKDNKDSFSFVQDAMKNS